MRIIINWLLPIVVNIQDLRLYTCTILPILTGNPAGSCNVIKSLSFLKCALLADMRSIIGTTCCCRDKGYSSHNHNVALNFCVLSSGREVDQYHVHQGLLNY